MSVQATAWVLRNSRATLGTRLVILALADYADERGGSCWPSVKTICQETLLSERQVQYALRALEQMGEIVVEQKGGGRRSTKYRLIMAEVQNLHPSENGRGAMDCTPEVQPVAPDPSVEPPEDQPLAAAPRRRNETWDALTALFGEATTRTSQTLRGKICRSLNQAGATPDEIRARAKRWRHVFPNAQLTEAALDKHWPLLQPPKPKPERVRVPEPPVPSPEQRATIAAAAREDMRQRRRSR